MYTALNVLVFLVVGVFSGGVLGSIMDPHLHPLSMPIKEVVLKVGSHTSFGVGISMSGYFYLHAGGFSLVKPDPIEAEHLALLAVLVAGVFGKNVFLGLYNKHIAPSLNGQKIEVKDKKIVEK